jgi:hypothetical protein
MDVRTRKFFSLILVCTVWTPLHNAEAICLCKDPLRKEPQTYDHIFVAKVVQNDTKGVRLEVTKSYKGQTPTVLIYSRNQPANDCLVPRNEFVVGRRYFLAQKKESIDSKGTIDVGTCSIFKDEGEAGELIRSLKPER